MRKGSHHSKESREKLRISRIGVPSGMLGKHHSDETKRKIGKANSIALKGGHLSKETCRRMSLSHIGKRRDNGRKGCHHTEKTKEKMRRSNRTYLLWQNPKYKRRQLEAICRGNQRKITKPERRLRNGLNKMFPGEYKFVGDGKVWIVGKNPDFINVNGQKKIIEIFGTFWHSENYTGRTKKEEEDRRINHFAKYGFRTLIVWQKELQDIRRLRKKLNAFHND